MPRSKPSSVACHVLTYCTPAALIFGFIAVNQGASVLSVGPLVGAALIATKIGIARVAPLPSG